ncbi:MAG TPA: putative lipid II flippase FtsW [bacterium]|nr:putative lipid II flippase FtsW [bacterium]
MKAHKPDKGLIIIVFSLLILGLVILWSASLVISQEKQGNAYYYFFHQLIYGGGVGLIAFLIFQKINYKVWKKFALIIFFASLLLLVLVFVPGLSYSHAGAQRWIAIKDISFQPSEFLKLAFVIYLAAFFSKKEINFNTLIPFLGIMVVVGILLGLQSDAGTLALLAILGFIIYFLSGAKFYQLAIVIFCYLAAFFVLIKFFPHRMARFITFLNPSIDPQGISYQINQALLAIGSGGLFGVGLGYKGGQKYNFLPEAMGDSIFAIAAEEVGFIGGLILIILFLLLALKGLKIARKVSNDFGKLLAIGITCWLVIQAFINITAITGLIPLTGITLPFVSYGGSALIMAMAGAGILVNISKHTK